MEDGELDLTFAALADPTRRAILARLARGEATVNVLAEPFAMSLQSVSRHLKVLEGAGLITRGRRAQFRPCALREEPLDGAARWIEQSRETWRHRVDRPRRQLEVEADGWTDEEGDGVPSGERGREAGGEGVTPTVPAFGTSGVRAR